LVFDELHRYPVKLPEVKVEAEGILTKLSTTTGNEGKRVRSAGHPRGLLGEEVEGGGLTGEVEIWPEATGTLFTRNGEKWEIGELVES
jgi:hypothetical protein